VQHDNLLKATACLLTLHDNNTGLTDLSIEECERTTQIVQDNLRNGTNNDATGTHDHSTETAPVEPNNPQQQQEEQQTPPPPTPESSDIPFLNEPVIGCTPVVVFGNRVCL